MRFEHIGYEEGTGKNSKVIETYNFHKAAAVLVEYGFDCIRLADDWHGADFLAHHKGTGKTLMVQLKSSLVIAKGYLPFDDLYMCFPLHGTDKWYLIPHNRLVQLVKEYSPQWLESTRWKEQDHYWSNSGNKKMRQALEDYAYQPLYPAFSFWEARIAAHKD